MKFQIFARSLGRLAFLLLGAMSLPIAAAEAAEFQVLYNFTGGNDGGGPSGVIRDDQGDLYGVTIGSNGAPMGTVFDLTPEGILTAQDSCVLNPSGTLVRANKGKLYGTGEGGSGGVFEMSPKGKCKVLHEFNGPPDGLDPAAGMIRDANGNLYGTTINGGDGGGCADINGVEGCGTVFKITSKGQETVLYSFTGGADGSQPYASLVMDGAGNLYGTTRAGGNFGGDCVSGCGTVFRIAPDATEKVLHAFNDCNPNYPPCDGSTPYGSLIQDSAGNFYGTTHSGGSALYGSVFKLAPDGTETLLHSFEWTDGTGPDASLTWDNRGNLYGTASGGGGKEGKGCGCGTVFKLSTKGVFKVLHRFDFNDGATPYAALLEYQGYMFGTTYGGGPDNAGVIYRIKE